MTPVSLTSVPLVSASLLNLIPIVAFINDQIIKATMKTKILNLLLTINSKILSESKFCQQEKEVMVEELKILGT